MKHLFVVLFILLFVSAQAQQWEEVRYNVQSGRFQGFVTRDDGRIDYELLEGAQVLLGGCAITPETKIMLRDTTLYNPKSSFGGEQYGKFVNDEWVTVISIIDKKTNTYKEIYIFYGGKPEDLGYTKSH